MIARWPLGFILGTTIIWLTSPLFVRSYLPREFNRGVQTLPAGESYRWRSEGYATSKVGHYGMVGSAGKTSPSQQTVALWGDSQAEGVCVGDDQKIATLADANSDFTVLPLARSGDDALDWIQQMPFADHELGVASHAFLITELSDLATIASNPSSSQWKRDEAQDETTRDTLLRWLPDFVIHAARNVLTQGDGVTPRRLRFRPGPTDSADANPPPKVQSIDWDNAIDVILSKTDSPIVLIYAPQLPRVMGGRIVKTDSDDESFSSLRSAAASSRIKIIDLRDSLKKSADQGDWPHGFQNGQIGVGHLNAIGNQVVADAIIRAQEDMDWSNHP